MHNVRVDLVAHGDTCNRGAVSAAFLNDLGLELFAVIAARSARGWV